MPPECEGSAPCPPVLSSASPPSGCPLCSAHSALLSEAQHIPLLLISVADPDPGSGAFLTLDQDPGSGIGFFRIPDPNPIFLELSDKFLGKKFYNSLKTGLIFFLQHLKNKILFNFVKFVVTKKILTTNFFTPLFCCCFWIRDPGPEILDPEWVKIRIRDKHPGSATLPLIFFFSTQEPRMVGRTRSKYRGEA